MTMHDRRRVLALLAGGAAGACTRASAPPAPEGYRWTRLTAAAPFPPSYNFPVHLSADGRFVALHPEGSWSSRDGAVWMREPLPPSGTNTAYLPLVAHERASWAIGTHRGNYLGFEIDPRIRVTHDHRGWRDLGRAESLPRLIFAAAASFGGAIWLLGGYDGRGETAGVWRSTDGLRWERVVERAPWSARSGAKAIAFAGRLWLLGGGVLDGALANDAWSSADGVEWRRECAAVASPEPTGFTPQVFDGRLWLVAANRSGGFRSAMLVSSDGRSLAEVNAPWTPRGGVATWEAGGRMFLTGGKYSHIVGGETRFVYSNDVWAMSR